MSGIEITARYRLRCDECGVYAEGPAVAHHTYMDAVIARDRIGKFDGWLLLPDELPILLCPECAATPADPQTRSLFYPVS